MTSLLSEFFGSRAYLLSLSRYIVQRSLETTRCWTLEEAKPTKPIDAGNDVFGRYIVIQFGCLSREAETSF
jgi:hypothetical protein